MYAENMPVDNQSLDKFAHDMWEAWVVLVNLMSHVTTKSNSTCIVEFRQVM